MIVMCRYVIKIRLTDLAKSNIVIHKVEYRDPQSQRVLSSQVEFNSILIQFMFLKWPKWMSPQGPPREFILLNSEMGKWLAE